MLRSHRLLLALGGALIFVGCTRETVLPPLTVAEAASPTGPGAAEPNLFAMPDGRVLLSWLERVDSTSHALRISIRGSDGTWGPVRDVLTRRDLFVNWADFPSVVALSDGRLVAHWLQKNGTGTYSYEVRMAESRDDGATWTASTTPHRPGIQAEHGFASLLPDSAGGARVFFLDGGANKIAAPAAAGHSHDEGHAIPMSVSVNSWSPGMTEATKTVIDARVCDCCQTASAMTARGPVVVFRDRSDEEIRDIAISRLVDGTWSTPAPVHADNWQINACPVNGPAIVASGNDVAVAWFTGARDTAKVHVAYSSDAGATFGAPVRVDGGTPAGRVGLQWLDGDAYVSWLERGNGDTAFVKVRRVARNGTMGEPITVSQSRGTRSSGFPRVARLPNGLIFAYTIPGTPSAVQVATLTRGQ